MATIALTRGLSALIDEADVEWLSAWKWCAVRVRAGSERFYAARPVKGASLVYMHREILKPGDGLFTDHANGDGLDNRRANLREATKSQNLCNGWNSRNKSGFRGVSRAKRGKPWIAVIQYEGRYRWIGAFDDAEPAARAYDAMARELHGAFARLNFPEAA